MPSYKTGTGHSTATGKPRERVEGTLGWGLAIEANNKLKSQKGVETKIRIKIKEHGNSQEGTLTISTH
jgi:hypothetical protein